MTSKVGNFNSSMVRLKELKQVPVETKSFNFNSSMVRLKARPFLNVLPEYAISIPLWCD